ncbi:RIP metalloprotease RseP [Pueribacillus theae]|uniref:Zinc metalloprotease n=1 Tax=Pueribacillus theae TaxID=2171751 RepID=A0A2U1K7N7_9BACI|nr:RIP metalloprotease RseP [Pueribacillus theae]PWA13537.1 RIP metalloprotease RseP [Pueribacillus theae]
MNSVIAIVIIFGLLVFIHELGHLLLAKRAGILCREFAIGFGPKIFSIKKSETVYTVRLLPLGGFVRMAGEDPEMIELKPGHRIKLQLNDDGVITKIIVNQKNKYPNLKDFTVEEADLEKGLYVKGYESEEGPLETYRVDPVCSYVIDGQEFQIAPIDRQFGSKTVFQRFLAIFAGPFMNFLLAFVILFIFALIYGAPSKEAVIGGVAEDGAAVEAGLQAGDRITAINGNPISNWDEFTEVIQTNPNQTLAFSVNRDGKQVNVHVTPDERLNYKGEKEGFIGVGYERVTSFLGSLEFGFDTTILYSKAIFTGLGQLITGKISIDNLSGPVGIYNYTDEAAQQGIATLMQWTAMLSVNLGLINLLPLPALDGGRLIFIILEGLRGKPIDPQKESLVHFVGFAFLMLLMIVVTWNDIQKFFL